MYDHTVTQRMIEESAKAINADARAHGRPEWIPTYSDIPTVQAVSGHLNDLWDWERKQLRRPLKQDEVDWIRNERRLCALDFNYWCNTTDAPIWMADLSFKPIGEIKVGDKVMGWEKADRPKLAKQFVRDHYTPATVLAVMRRKAPVIEVTMASGRVVKCTPDHLWSNGNSGRQWTGKYTSLKSGETKIYPKKLWTQAKPGATLRFALDPVDPESLTNEQRYYAGWLGGIIDGEGSIGASGFRIAQYQKANPEVHAKIAEALDALHFEYSADVKGYYIKGGAESIVRCLLLCRPAKWNKALARLCQQVLTQRDKVVSVRSIGEHEVVSMQTTTGNYVAWGYLSKNCSRYAYIVDWQKRPVLFQPNVAQSIVIDLWAEDEANGYAIQMQQLKARRLGVSTVSELNVCWRFHFHSYSNCVVASADPQKTIEMAGMIRFCHEKQPWWLLPKATKIKHAMPAEFGELHSILSIEAGNQFTGVARGGAPNVVHLSELCEWQDAADLIDGALLPAILDSQDVFLILESTAKGPGWWKNKWEQVKRDWDRGTGKIRPVFLPWYVGTDIYPTPADMRKRPIPEGWVPDDRTVSHAERARQYVLANPMLFKYLAKGDKNWRMPRAQMWWREMGYQSAREEKTLNIFLAEYAGDDFEAFQNSNIPIIDTEVLIGYEERTREPKGVYTIVGPDIPPALVTPRRFWDLDKPPIPIYTRDLVPKLDVKYQLIPLKWQGYAEIDFDLKLFIWEFPDDNHSYGLGVDTSEGIGQDRAVISALRESTPTRGPGQVAEWASAYVTAFQLWPLVMALGCLYSTHSKAAQRRVQCRLAIECWANGAACQHELQKRGWTNFHPWKSYDSRKQRKDGEVNKLGVFTNMTFKALMFDMLLTMLSEEAIDLPSPYLIDELKTLERAGDRRSPQAAPDAYDDRVMGLGFPLFSLHMGKPSWKQHARQRVQYVPGDETEAKPNYAIWRPDQQALDLPNPALMRVARGSLRQQAQILRHVNDRMPKGWR